jgi:hypothetical protein
MLSLYPDFIKFPYFADPTERQVWGWQRQGEDNGDLMENSIIYYSFLPNAIFIVIETKSISCCFPSNKLLAKGPKGQLYSLWSSVLEFFPKPLNKKLVHILNYQCPPQKECLAILKVLFSATHFHMNLSAQLGFGLLFVTPTEFYRATNFPMYIHRHKPCSYMSHLMTKSLQYAYLNVVFVIT